MRRAGLPGVAGGAAAGARWGSAAMPLSEVEAEGGRAPAAAGSGVVGLRQRRRTVQHRCGVSWLEPGFK